MNAVHRLLAGAGATCALILVTGCGGGSTVSQTSYDELVAGTEQVTAKLEQAEKEITTLKKEATLAEAGTAEGETEPVAEEECAAGANSGRPNVETTFNPTVESPKIDACSYIDPAASVTGNVEIGPEVYVSADAHVRGDEGQPIVIGKGTNVQDGVTLHALETEEEGEVIAKNLVEVDGKKYALHIGKNVSLAHGAMVHGPASVGDNTFVGMMAFVFKAQIGSNVVIEPGALVLGVKIPNGRYVPAGENIKTQEQADALPKITKDYPFKDLNDGVLHVNHQLAEGYRTAGEGSALGSEKPEGENTAAAEKAAGHELAANGVTEAER